MSPQLPPRCLFRLKDGTTHSSRLAPTIRSYKILTERRSGEFPEKQEILFVSYPTKDSESHDRAMRGLRYLPIRQEKDSTVVYVDMVDIAMLESSGWELAMQDLSEAECDEYRFRMYTAEPVAYDTPPYLQRDISNGLYNPQTDDTYRETESE